MYSLSFIKKSLKLLQKYDGKITKTAREIGVKVRTLTEWKRKSDLGLPLLIWPYKRINNSKYTKEQKKIALKYYFEHGHNVSATCRLLGFPKNSTLKYWLYQNRKYQKLRKLETPIKKHKLSNNKGNKPRKLKISFLSEKG